MAIADCHAHPNAVAEQLSGRNYLSYSAVSLYQRCPLAYRFRYVDNLPEQVVSSSLAFGGGIHAALERWFVELLAGSPTPSHDDLLAAFWDAWRCKDEQATIAFGKDEDSSAVAEVADRVLAAFRSSELAAPQGRIIGVEEELRGAVIAGVPDLLARVDLLVESDDALTVIDFKTARSRWSEGQAQDQAEQLLLYGELARELAPGKELRLEFAVVTKAKTPAVDRHLVQVDADRVARTQGIVRRVWQAIEQGHFYPAPSPMNCPSCPFREPCRQWRG